MPRFSLCLASCAAAVLALAPACNQAAQRAIPETSAAQQQGVGWDALAKKEYPRAQLLFENAVARDPQFVDAWLGLGHALFWQGRFREARTAYDHVNQLAPADPRALGAIAHCDLNLATHA